LAKEPPPSFDPALFEALRAERGLGSGAPCVALAVTGSTNDDALAAARRGAAAGTIFVADAQTAGRGRRGNQWFAAPGESLLCSVVLRADLAAKDVPPLALAAGLAIRHAVERTLAAHGVSTSEHLVRVKWPNDVWVDGKKLAGVLAESQLQGDRLLAVVVGFGINVATTTFPEPLAGRVTSLHLLGAEAPREALLVEVLAALADRVDALCRNGVAWFSEELGQNDALLGRRLRLSLADEQETTDAKNQKRGTERTLEGTALGIDGEGCLILREKGGRIVHLRGGAVELLD
jgi:BirA family biotin operon repressor/biotin-[acetyl-CoA-carboxylase] ligase